MKSEGGEAYRDEVLARIFRYQRDKRIERQIALIQSALKDIRKDMQSLRESIAHGHLDEGIRMSGRNSYDVNTPFCTPHPIQTITI